MKYEYDCVCEETLGFFIREVNSRGREGWVTDGTMQITEYNGCMQFGVMMRRPLPHQKRNPGSKQGFMNAVNNYRLTALYTKKGEGYKNGFKDAIHLAHEIVYGVEPEEGTNE